MGSCDLSTYPCCGDMICEETDTFGKVCKDAPGLCIEEHTPCLRNDECCNGLKWFASTTDHRACLNIGDCSDLNQPCNVVQPCCNGMFCREGNCEVLPACLALGNKCGAYSEFGDAISTCCDKLICHSQEETSVCAEYPVCPDSCGECGCCPGTTECFVCAPSEFIVSDGTSCSCSVNACDACPNGSVCIPPSGVDTATTCVDCECGFCKLNKEPCCEPNKEVDANNCKSTGQASVCTLQNFVGFTSSGNSCQGEEGNAASVDFGCGCVPANNDVCAIIPKGENCFLCRKDDVHCNRRMLRHA